MADLTIFHTHPQCALLLPFQKPLFQKLLKAMQTVFHKMGHHDANLETYLVTDAEIAKINLSKMNLPGPTNILSFPGDNELPHTLILSLDTLCRECILYGQNPRQYLIFLLAHGFGHLAGENHGKKHQRIASFCQEAGLEALKTVASHCGDPSIHVE